VPAGKRISTYENAEYKKEAGAFADATLKAIETADPVNPGVQPRPTIGIQFVDIPEFPDLGTKVSQDISAVIADKKSVDDALNNGQKLAEVVSKKYQGQ
jgi:sorbitol/mannitol transport system substrate-binding protein